MILCDVNVLVYAHREDATDHVAYREWLESVINGDESYAVADIVLSSFLRIVSHSRVFDPPSTLAAAIAFVREIREQENCVVVTPSPRQFGLFLRLCEAVGARGNLVPDAYLAALAIDSGCEWVSTDRDFTRFPGLRYRHPLAH